MRPERPGRRRVVRNEAFHRLLRGLRDVDGQRLTIGRLAAAIYVNRARLNDVCNNQPGQGRFTRGKVRAYLTRHHPSQAAAVLAALGWEAKEAAEAQTQKLKNGVPEFLSSGLSASPVPPATMFHVEPT